jgi:hypothetical protein
MTNASQASSLVSLSLTVAMVHYGYGKTKALLDHAQMTTALKYSNFAVLVNGFAMAFLKISVGMSLLRLQLGKGMIWIVWISIFLSVAVNALVLVTSLFGCRPIAAIWDKSLMPTSTCLPRTVYVANGYVQASKSMTVPMFNLPTVKADFLAAGNILTDLFYSLSPLYYLSKVKVSVYNKWALRSVFMIGLLATVCALAKCTELPKLGSSTNPTCKCIRLLPFKIDKQSLIISTDDGTRLTIWVRAELNAGLVAAAIPPLKSLFENVLRNVFGVRSQFRSTTGYATHKTGSRRSRTRDLEDDEIAMRSHAAHVYSSNDSRVHASDDGGDSTFEDHRNDSGREKSSSDTNGRGPITKTMSYSVRRDDTHEGA